MVKKIAFFFIVLSAVVVVHSFFYRYPISLYSDNASTDLDSIRKRGKLIALTDFNSTDYFIYKGEPMGFNYELLKSFTRHLGIGLEIITENDLDKAVGMLQSGKADLMAIGMPENTSGIKELKFSEPVDETRHVLVSRKNGKYSADPYAPKQNQARDQLGLGMNTIYIQTGFSEIESLMNLASSMGDSINILDVPYEQEKLIRYVAEGIIDYTVCDENVALVNSTYYPSIDISIPAGPVQKLAWSVRNDTDTLLVELNSWIKDFMKSREYAFLYSKYFRNSRSGIIIRSDYYANETGKISRYDDMIRKYSAHINWDWRLIASLICQESRFNPGVESGAGAYGLMQIMPITGEYLGIDIKASTENNIIAGIKYIDRLHAIFDPKIPDEEERINFILASYNAGPGHVLDAMKLAEKYGRDPCKWEGNVEDWLLKKSEPQHYNDSLVKNGYFRGVESVNFVAQVLDRYSHYKNVIPEVKLKKEKFPAYYAD